MEDTREQDERWQYLIQQEPLKKIKEEMSASEVHEIFRKIASGERQHGDFLTCFAEAMLHADTENFQILKPVAEQLIKKYNVEGYV